MNCPYCRCKMDVSEVPSTYIWNKGLPKTFCSQDWKYYTCEKCYNKRKGENSFFCFVFLPDKKIYMWDNTKHYWKKMNLALNPSRRDSPYIKEEQKR